MTSGPTRATTRLPFSAPFLPLAMEFVDKGARAFGYGQREAAGPVLATEELFAFYLRQAATSTSVDIELEGVIHAASGRAVSFAQLASFMLPEDRVCIADFVAPVCTEIPDTAKGFFIGFPHVIFTYAAHLARVEVDVLSGQIRVAGNLLTRFLEEIVDRADSGDRGA